MTLEESIERLARLTPQKEAIVSGSQSVTYATLWERILNKSTGLGNETFHLFRNSQDVEFVLEYCAAHTASTVAVPVEASATDGQLKALREELTAHTEALAAHRPYDILYTTGTTGKSKGVMISRRAWEANTANLIDRLQFHSELLFVISGPLNHLGSLSKLHATLSAGGTVCLLSGMTDMNAFLSALALPYPRVATFLVPASIRILLQFAETQIAALSGRIDFIETGAAPISEDDMRHLCRLLPHSRLYNTYASTESGIVASYDYNGGNCTAGCVGRPMKHSRITISPDGHIVCGGDTLMSGYFNDEAATAQVLAGRTIRTSDLGHIDSEGLLHITGRDNDTLNVGGYKVSPVEVENAAMTLPYIRDCVCTTARHPLLGTALRLLVVLAPDATLDKHAIARHLKTRLESYKVPLLYEAVSSIERTYNGKIDRKHYL